MPRTRVQRVQDCVHGLMHFSGMETVVIDVLRTPELQRLRRIRQLGLAHLVFPGAEHSRLVHSLGAAYLAIRFGRHLRDQTEDHLTGPLRPRVEAVRDLGLAALCHDLGHGPFSHAWEREIIGEPFDEDSWLKSLGLEEDRELLKGAKWHELVGQAFLAWPQGVLHQLLEQQESDFSTRIRLFLRGHHHVPYLPKLLSSDIDVDRGDFLQRDAVQSGVGYGDYDVEWLLSTCMVGDAAGTLTVGFDERKAVRVVEQFLLARAALYETVYQHRTVRSAEGMLGLFLRRLKEIVRAGAKLEAGGLVEPLVRMISGQTLSPPELLSLDDYSVWALLEMVATQKGIDKTVNDLGGRLLRRDLFKQVPVSSDAVENFIVKEDKEALAKIVEPYAPGESRFYVHVDISRFSMFSNKASEAAYFVDANSRNAYPVHDHPKLRKHWQEPRKLYRLFTIQEAVDALGHAVGG